MCEKLLLTAGLIHAIPSLTVLLPLHLQYRVHCYVRQSQTTRLYFQLLIFRATNASECMPGNVRYVFPLTCSNINPACQSIKLPNMHGVHDMTCRVHCLVSLALNIERKRRDNTSWSKQTWQSFLLSIFGPRPIVSLPRLGKHHNMSSNFVFTLSELTVDTALH